MLFSLWIAPVLNFPKIILIFLTYKSQNSTINIWKHKAGKDCKIQDIYEGKAKTVIMRVKRP